MGPESLIVRIKAEEPAHPAIQKVFISNTRFFLFERLCSHTHFRCERTREHAPVFERTQAWRAYVPRALLIVYY